jgi:hypothetical protein
MPVPPWFGVGKMQSVVFDDRGEQWDTRSHRLAEALQASLAGEELTDYVVRNLGFATATDNKGSLRIRVRPAVISPIAFSALLYWLLDRPTQRILLSIYDRGWTHEMFGRQQDAVDKLLRSCGPSHDNRPGEFLRRRLDPKALPRSSPLRGLLNIWAETFHLEDRERLWGITREALNGRYALFEASERNSNLVFREIGPGFLSFNDTWLAQARGLRIEDQPDFCYGKWLAATYQDAMKGSEPCLEDVDAIINKPDGGRRRVRYRRLILTGQKRKGPLSVLSASVIDDSIDLRVEGGQEMAQV